MKCVNDQKSDMKCVNDQKSDTSTPLQFYPKIDSDFDISRS